MTLGLHCTTVLHAALIAVPVKTPNDIQKKLQGWNDQIIRNPEYVSKLAEMAIDPILMTPAEAAAFIVAETATADPVNAKKTLKATTFIPEELFPNPLTWTWYAIEYDGADLFYGFVDGDEPELGYFRLSELVANRGKWGLPIERDRYFDPCLLSVVQAKVEQRRLNSA